MLLSLLGKVIFVCVAVSSVPKLAYDNKVG